MPVCLIEPSLYSRSTLSLTTVFSLGSCFVSAPIHAGKRSRKRTWHQWSNQTIESSYSHLNCPDSPNSQGPWSRAKSPVPGFYTATAGRPGERSSPGFSLRPAGLGEERGAAGAPPVPHKHQGSRSYYSRGETGPISR